MKKLILSLFTVSALLQPAFAVEVSPAQTEDPKQAETLQKEQLANKVPIEVRREELKKKHKAKKAAKQLAAEKAAVTPSPTTTVNAEPALVNEIKVEQKTDAQREDNKNRTH